MPVFQEITGRLNEQFRHGKISDIDAALFDSDASLAEIASSMGVVGNSDSDDFKILDAIPRGMQAALRALIRNNLSRQDQDRWEMTFAWAPGYDYEVSMWEAPSTVMSRAGITVMLRTRYPLDQHPSEL